MTASRPNILLIVSHDLGRHLGCYGIDTVQTPNLDRLAGEGVRFSQAFCTAPQCSPSRAALFTGRYPHNNGVMGLCHSPFEWDLHPGERHLASFLKDAGYFTALIGTQHETRRPRDMGYDVIPNLNGDAKVVAPASLEFFAQREGQSQPFYLQVGFFEPHRRPPYGYYCEPDVSKGLTVPPYLVDELSAREDFAGYQGAIRLLDLGVGRVLQGLADHGLADNTLVIFTTDHGIPYPRAKCSLYDPGLEIAQIMRWPAGGFRGGRVIEGMVSNLDVLPTLLELTEVTPPTNLHGRSFLPMLHGEAGGRSEMFAQMTYHDYCDPRRCIRTLTHKLIVNFTNSPAFMDPSQTWRPQCVTVVPAQPKLAYHPLVELYDLEKDPLEHHDLSQEPGMVTVKADLLHRLQDWMVQTQDPLLAGIPISPFHQRALAALAGT